MQNSFCKDLECASIKDENVFNDNDNEQVEEKTICLQQIWMFPFCVNNIIINSRVVQS